MRSWQEREVERLSDVCIARLAAGYVVAAPLLVVALGATHGQPFGVRWPVVALSVVAPFYLWWRSMCELRAFRKALERG